MQNISANQSEFWDKVALVKEFKDSFYLVNLEKYINNNSFIVEYGCGYGRLLNFLHENNYQNTIGFDFSKEMIAKGNTRYPHLSLKHINHADVPLQKSSVDAAILSTVLCCVPNSNSQSEIITELLRILKPNAVLYVIDFLITDNDHMKEKYQKDFMTYNEWGVYSTSEGAVVRHHTCEYIKHLLNNFNELQYLEENFVTMNNNAVKTFHGIYKKVG